MSKKDLPPRQPPPVDDAKLEKPTPEPAKYGAEGYGQKTSGYGR